MNNKESINLKNYWNDEKKDKRIEKNPPKQDIKKEHNNQMNMNLDDENKSTIAFVGYPKIRIVFVTDFVSFNKFNAIFFFSSEYILSPF